LHEAAVLQGGLHAGPVGTVLLVLLQIGYVPNAVIWGMAFAIGPGFAFGAGTVVAPPGSALGQLPAVPLLAALPPGVHASMPAWLAPLVLALPYLAGGTGGWLLIRMAPTLSLEAAPLWGMACGAITGVLTGILAAFAGGPLGDGRLAVVGPSGWAVGAVAAFELGIAAAISAGVSNFIVLRRAGAAARSAGAKSAGLSPAPPPVCEPPPEHIRYLDPWAGDEPASPPPPPVGPASLP